jgi:hypothetical protein
MDQEPQRAVREGGTSRDGLAAVAVVLLAVLLIVLLVSQLV